MMMQISKIQYITNYQSEISHFDQVEQVIQAGIKWVQYRPKETSEEVILTEGQEIANICRQHSVTFIMNDRADLAAMLKADGVHLGKNDMSPSEARELLGPNKIIGGTANTIEDIRDLVEQGVNYIGLGPYKFTNTKKNLSPVLGLDGYAQIINTLNNEGVSIPIVAIGGIKKSDFQTLKNTGVYGVAISSLISHSEDIKTATKEILQLF